MLSLNERIKLLENDLKAFPMRISAYHDLTFTILRYDPDEDWTLRRELRLLMTRLQLAGKCCHPFLSASCCGERSNEPKD